MAEMKGKNKRLPINLSFLTLSNSRRKANARYSPTHSDGPNGVVGLGIVAVMKDDRNRHRDIFLNSGAVLAISLKSASNSIPIIKNNSCKKIIAEVEECEEYTRVISHAGKNLIENREYFEAEILGTSDAHADAGVSSEHAFLEADFLSCCVLCEKKLHGLDVFMYRGDKAFCSAECRCKQISIDERREKWHSRARRARMKYSVSPCSVAAA